MPAHIIEPHERRSAPTGTAVASRTTVAAVGTFAAGQSRQGSFHVAADAKLGSFASRPAASHDARPA
jgi:hypothetical protein